MDEHPSVVEYQVRQTMNGFDAYVCLVAPADLHGLHSRLTRALVLAGLAEPVVRLVSVPSISRLDQSAKLRRFVPIG